MAVDVSVVVPVYNSALIIPELVLRVDKALNASGITYELILTDDCSTDQSWEAISQACLADNRIIGLRLAKNRGQWCSTLAGMSRANGKYIVTIDDDLEYEPADIVKLYKAITGSDYYVVYGMAKDKYRLQGRVPQLSKFRKALMHALWNSPPTDNFRIFPRSLVFSGHKLLPQVFMDAYLVKHVEERFIGYEEVSFNKRFMGESNVRFLKRVQLFLLYRTQFALKPAWRNTGFVLLFSGITCLFYFLPAGIFLLPLLASLLLFTALLNLYWLLSVYRKNNDSPLYLIAEELNKKPHNCILLPNENASK